MGQKTVRFDDLLGTETDEVAPHTFTVDGVEVDPLDLLPSTFAALEALLAKHDAEPLRALFAPEQPRKQRTKVEVDAIRAAARQFGGFEVQDSGRLPRKVVLWYENHYLPALAEADAQAETPAEETPTKSRARK
jgi:hypothetical protein